MSKIFTINFKFLFIIFSAIVINFSFVGCKNTNIKFEVYETSKSGNKLTLIKDFELTGQTSEIVLNYDDEFQTITGFGGAFTESSAYLLNQLSQAKKFEVLKSYFRADDEAKFMYASIFSSLFKEMLS